ncbi:MAG: zinc-binding alcohol dehydrogenase [Nitriliruptoraceae bacterium]
MSPRQLVVTAPRSLAYRSIERRPLAATEIRLKTVASAISHGTELHLYRGTSPFASRSFDPRLRVFSAPAPGVDEATPLGYELVGEVVELGSQVDQVAVGDLVHAAVPHADEVVVDLARPEPLGYPAQRLPDDMPVEAGLFTALACVALFATHDAAIKLGDRVVVSGLGVIGQLAVQLARLDGATTVLAVDPIAERRSAAVRLGADDALDPGAEAVGAGVKRRLGGQGRDCGADVVVETSGAAAALHEAIASVRVGGTIVSVGFAQGGAPQLRLGEEWHHNRPQLVSSMGVWDCPHRDHPRWDRLRVARTALSLLASGALRVEDLVGPSYRFEEAAAAYALLDGQVTPPLKVVLRYDA